MKLSKLLFQDETGKYVLGQPPNAPLYMILIGGFGKTFTSDGLQHFFELWFFGSACIWSYLEIRYGSSYFRRLLGVVVVVLIFCSRLAL